MGSVELGSSGKQGRPYFGAAYWLVRLMVPLCKLAACPRGSSTAAGGCMHGQGARGEHGKEWERLGSLA